MLAENDEERPAPLHQICKLADELARVHPRAQEIVREIFGLALQLAREEHEPQLIETAPKLPSQRLLLYCPNQGGWHIGEWLTQRWVEAWTMDFLQPTHWSDVPPEPEPEPFSPPAKFE